MAGSAAVLLSPAMPFLGCVATASMSGWAAAAAFGPFRDVDAKHLEFSMNPWRTPQRIDSHNSFDQSAFLDGRRRSAAAPPVHPGQPRPELPEALPLPAHHRVGLYVDQRAAPVTPNPRQT